MLQALLSKHFARLRAIFWSWSTAREQLADIVCSSDPFAEADEDTGETKQSQNYIHIRIQRQ